MATAMSPTVAPQLALAEKRGVVTELVGLITKVHK